MSITILDKYQNNLLGFALTFFKDNLNPLEDFQVRWLHAVGHHIDSQRAIFRMCVSSCKGAGKTTMQAITLIWFVMCFPKPKIRAMASTRSQTKSTILHECKRLISESPLLCNLFEFQSFSIFLKEDNGTPSEYQVIRGLSADEERPEAVAGDHALYNLYVVDEASHLGRNVYDSINGILVTGTSYLILSGNPTDQTGQSLFYEICTSNYIEAACELQGRHLDEQRLASGRWMTMKVSSKDLKRPNYNRSSLELIYAPGSIGHTMYVDGDFPIAKTTSYLTIEQMRSTFNVGRKLYSIPMCRVNEAHVVGIDIGLGIGKDYTCIMIRNNNQAKCVLYKNDMLIEELQYLILEYSTTGAKIVVDCSGVGRQVLIWLNSKGAYNIIDVSQNSNPSDKNVYKNRKSELLWRAKDWIINYDPYIDLTYKVGIEERFVREGLEMYVGSKDGRSDIGNKAEMKKSPDLFDALSFTFLYGYVTNKVEQQPFKLGIGDNIYV